MTSRAKEYASHAELAEIGGVVSYAGLFFLAAVVAGGVLLGQGAWPLPSVFPLVGSGILTVCGRRAFRRRDHWSDAAHAERELTEGSR